MRQAIIFFTCIIIILCSIAPVNADYKFTLKYPEIHGLKPEGGILGYVKYIYFLGLSIIGAAALFALVYGGFMYITSDAITSKEEAKKWMLGAATGLLLGLLSYLILFTINPDLVKWELNIPETPAGPQPSLPEEGSLICRSEQGYHYEWPLEGECDICKKGLKTEDKDCEEKGARICEVPVPIKDKFCETPVCCYENTHLICDENQMCKRIEGAGENECVNENQHCSLCNKTGQCTEEQCVGHCPPKEKWDNQLCKCVKNPKCFTSNECTEEECAPDGKCGGDFYWDASTCTCKYTPQEFTCQSEPGKQRMCLDACTQRFPISAPNLTCPENQICCEESECQINGYYCHDSCPQGFAPIPTYSCGPNYVCCEISGE